MGMVLEVGLVALAAFLLLCVLASKISVKFGIPSLLFFVGIGMLAGSDGPGGIDFSDVHLTKNVGMLALALILFAGGLESPWPVLRPVAWRGLSLATFGVAITAVLVAGFAYLFLGLQLVSALLLGAVVSSTDAAAIFALLRTSGLRLRHNLAPLLEFESGTNDPLAAFLTIAITGLEASRTGSAWSIGARFLLEMPIGFAVGWAAARGGVWLINRLRLKNDGLYPLITIAVACGAFGGAGLLHGNSFLAVYVAGVVLGSRQFLHRLALLQFHDAVAWMSQICMFVLLGLLVFPQQLLAIAVPGLLLSLFLIFVARPIAVFVSLARARLPVGAKLFVSWAGLRGAVPIILATIPLMQGVSGSVTIFNLVFFIVLLSVAIQGTTMPLAAKYFKVRSRRPPIDMELKPVGHKHLIEVEIPPGSIALGRQVIDLGLPATALLVLLTRQGEAYIPRGGTVIEPGDTLLIATRREDEEELRAKFAPR